MSEAKHTPGPWSVAERLGFGWLIHPNVAVAYGGEGSGKQDEGEHNARLIAAAPDLLTSVKLFRDTIEYLIKADRVAGDDEGARLKSFTLEDVKDLIAKAEGRS